MCDGVMRYELAWLDTVPWKGKLDRKGMIGQKTSRKT